MRAKLLITSCVWMASNFHFATSQQSVSYSEGQEAVAKKAFIYYLKVYGHDPHDLLNADFARFNGLDQYWKLYANYFDSQNYNSIKGNEFEVKKYENQICDRLFTDIAKTTFTEKMILRSFVGNISLGEYSFNEHCFPINHNSEWVTYLLYKSYLLLKIGAIDNYENIEWKLKMNETEAGSFLKRRKDSTGYINRDVYFKITLSILSKRMTDKESWFGTNQIDFWAHIYTIDVYSDISCTQKIGTITP